MFKYFLSKIKERRQRKKEYKISNFREIIGRQLVTTSKMIIWVFTINAVLWIWCSYVLAFLGRDDIAEALSGNVCTVIIGQLAFYLVTKTVENVFKYNNFGGVTNPYLLGKEDNNGELNNEQEPGDVDSEYEPEFTQHEPTTSNDGYSKGSI